MTKHLYNPSVEKPFLSMTGGNLGDLIPLNQNQKKSVQQKQPK